MIHLGNEWYVHHDGCISIRWTNAFNGRERVQRKRRPRGATPEVCSWVLACPDHPDKEVRIPLDEV